MPAKDDEEELLRSVALRNARSILDARRRAEDELRKQSEWLRVTLASIGDAVISTDTDGCVTFMNAVAEALTGWSQAEAHGKPLPEVFHIINEQSRQPVENPAVRALRDRVIVGLANHTILIAKDGTERPIDDSAAPIRTDDGEIAGCVLVFRDVSERRHSEKRLSESEQFVKHILDASPGIVYVFDLEERRTVFVNQRVKATIAITAEEITAAGQQFMGSRVHPDDLPVLQEHLIRIESLSDGDVRAVEYRMRHADGRWLWFLSRDIVFQRNALGKPRQVLGVASDITDRKRSEDRLRQLAADLSEADRRKNEFLAMLAHELRNPLAPIRNALQIVRLSPGDGAAVQSASEMMERQIAQMVRLVDDLLDVSRITRGKIELRQQRVELASIVTQAIETCQPVIDNAKHELSVSLPASPVYLHADPIRLAQAFFNLLNNACKYMEPGGRITLMAEVQGSDVVVSVQDTGIGIPADMLPKVFEMFTQVDRSLERTQGGLGIGLTLVRRLVEMHGGSIKASSEGTGQGSEFVVRLPILIEKTKPASAPGLSKASAPTLHRILVVDDNRDSATSLAKLLEITGNTTQIAYDGVEAFATAETFKPEVILLDIGLPKLNGYEVARRIREHPWGQKMILVALTGWGQEEDRQKSKEAGFDGHMVKPVDHAELMKLLGE